ncbi:MAG: hypothetical protein M3Q07_23230 [Pseudobdellovibrionaceae bacterium]|nr:hypothetical protein [Pseudobdellovibrionaceae bacterium]
MHKLLLVFIVLMSTILHADPQDFEVYGPRLTPNYAMDRSAFFPADRLRLQDIRSQLPRLQSYEAFLDYLAERRPSLFESSVLIHDTGSLQYADRERPRVILFGDGLMLAFAEDPRHDERTVEIIAFDDTTSEFQFAELQFAKGSSQFHDQPKQCASCHGSAPKPLWDPYDFWPNIYGSSIARFGTVAEKNAYEKIRLQPSKQGIYDRLNWSVPPGTNNRGLLGIEAFTQYVTQLQIFASLPRWKKQPGSFRQSVPALLAVLNHCAVDPNDGAAAQKLAAFFPDPWKNSILLNFAERHQRVKQDRQRLKTYQTSRYKQHFANSPTLFAVNHDRLGAETQTVAQFHMVLEMAGIDTRDFALSQGPNAFLLSVPSNLDADLATNLALVAPDIFQRLAPRLVPANPYDYTWARFDCQSLKEESLMELQSLQPASLKAEMRPAPTVFGECISCHSINPGQTGAPPIPFDQTGDLRTWLQQGPTPGLQKILERIQKSGPGQMPPYRKLNREEQEQLRLNLERIGM